MSRLALPVVVGELGWMAMGVVDTLMVGRIDAESIGAVGIGRAVFLFAAIVGLGVLLGLDTLVSQAFGAGDLEGSRRWLVDGTHLALIMSVPLVLLTQAAVFGLGDLGIDRGVLPLAEGYLRAVSFSGPPLFVFFALRRYLQAINVVRAVMIALVSANLVNVAANWLLIFGRFGAPRLGAAGAGVATVLAMLYLTGFLALVIVRHARENGVRLAAAGWLRADPARLRRLAGLGLPAGLHLLFEVGVFALATLLIGRLAPAALAAHQIALNCASVTYMVPLGISAAAAVRVGQAIGRNDRRSAAAAGWTAIVLATSFMLAAAASFVLFSSAIIRAFSDDRAVLEVGVTLLAIAALFQLFDGLQVVATGALRGAGDTRTPMVWNLVGYWAIAFPVGLSLGFGAGWGAAGIWSGLAAGLIVVGSALLLVWARRARDRT